MADPLEDVIRDLRREKCPPAVQHGVDLRLARRPRAVRGWAPWLMWGAAAASVVLTLWMAAPPGPRAVVRVPADASREQALVVEQTVGALALVGQTLIHTASRAGDSFLEDAAPPLVKSFQTTKTKLTDNL